MTQDKERLIEGLSFVGNAGAGCGLPKLDLSGRLATIEQPRTAARNEGGKEDVEGQLIPGYSPCFGWRAIETAVFRRRTLASARPRNAMAKRMHPETLALKVLSVRTRCRWSKPTGSKAFPASRCRFSAGQNISLKLQIVQPPPLARTRFPPRHTKRRGRTATTK